MASTRSVSLKVMLVCALLILSVGQLAAAEGEDLLGPMKHSADNSLKEKLCEYSQKCIFRPDDRICFQNCMVGSSGGA
jgi:hypothetical protein